MKTLLLLLTVFGYTIASCQDIPESKVPSVVVNTLKAKFSNAKDLEWEKKANGYEAEFDLNKIDHKALLDASGKLVMYKQDIAPADLPEAVVHTIHTKYGNADIDDVEKIDKGEITFYQVELDGTSGDQKLVINADGEVNNVQRYW